MLERKVDKVMAEKQDRESDQDEKRNDDVAS
jgi:hypothetical protein